MPSGTQDYSSIPGSVLKRKLSAGNWNSELQPNELSFPFQCKAYFTCLFIYGLGRYLEVIRDYFWLLPVLCLGEPYVISHYKSNVLLTVKN